MRHLGLQAPRRPAAVTLDPCRLLPATTLDSLTGVRVEQQGPAVDVARGSACRWHLPDPAGLDGAELVITTWHGQQFYAPGTIGPPLCVHADPPPARSVDLPPST